MIDIDLPHKGEADGLTMASRKNQLSISLHEILRSLQTPSNILCISVFIILIVVFLQGLPGSIPWGVYSSYLHDILANEKQFSPDAVSFHLSTYG